MSCTDVARNHEIGRPLCLLVFGPETILRSVKQSSHTASVYLSQNGGTPEVDDFRTFGTDGALVYEAFCNDFGPMNFAPIVRFVEILDEKISSATMVKPNIVYCAETGPKALTNAAFLLGCYLILKMKQSAISVAVRFQNLDPGMLEAYRDAGRTKATFGLDLIDCWRSVELSMQKGWIGLPTLDSPSTWGCIDLAAYDYYDDPLNADLHEVVPKQLIIFRGPKTLDGSVFRNNFKNRHFTFRDFSPEYYIDILKELGVTTIVRLNHGQYDQNVFLENGFQHLDLPCGDNVFTPPLSLVSRFFKIMDEATGCVAIHGQSSFGRAGTLAALHLMRSHGFTAREAIAWVRIMRPGCIVGRQQEFLCNIETSISKVVSSIPQTGSIGTTLAESPTPGSRSCSSSLADQPNAIREYLKMSLHIAMGPKAHSPMRPEPKAGTSLQQWWREMDPMPSFEGGRIGFDMPISVNAAFRIKSSKYKLSGDELASAHSSAI